VSICPSVCLSFFVYSVETNKHHFFVYSVETNKHVFKMFSPSGSHAILVFFVANVMVIFRRVPSTPNGASNASGLAKIVILDQQLAFGSTTGGRSTMPVDGAVVPMSVYCADRHQ